MFEPTYIFFAGLRLVIIGTLIKNVVKLAHYCIGGNNKIRGKEPMWVTFPLI